MQAGPIVIQKEEVNYFGKKILYGVLILALLIIGIIITVKLVRAFKKAPNANYVTGGGSIPDNWLPGPIAKELFEAIDGVDSTSTKDTAYSRFNDLNDNQKISVYNEWLKEKYDQKGWPDKHGTLTNAIKNETGYISFSGVNQMDVMIANLDRLQLK